MSETLHKIWISQQFRFELTKPQMVHIFLGNRHFFSADTLTTILKKFLNYKTWVQITTDEIKFILEKAHSNIRSYCQNSKTSSQINSWNKKIGFPNAKSFGRLHIQILTRILRQNLNSTTLSDSVKICVFWGSHFCM